MIIECSYFDKQYRDKPTSDDVRFLIQKSLKPVKMDIKDLASGLVHGCTFRPAVLNGMHKADWQRQELFGIDIDHGMNIDEGLQKCKDLKLLPAFGYTSFSHLKNNEHRFRLVFHSDRMITNVDERNKIQLALMAAFPECDPSCKNGDRLFFGGKVLIYENYDMTFNADKLIEKFYKPSEDKPKPKKEKKDKPLNDNKPVVKKFKKALADFEDNHDEKIKAIKDLDVDRMRELLGIIPVKPTRSIHFEFLHNPETEKAIDNTIDRLNKELGFALNENYNIPNFSMKCIEDIMQIIIDEQNKEQVKIKLKVTITDIEDDNNSNNNDNSDNNNSDLESNARKNGLITKTLISSPTFLEKNDKNLPNMLFDNESDLFDYIDTLDLFEYLGVGEGYFNCILPKHDDDKPSAHIYITDDGRQVYKCFGCDKTRSIVGMTEELSGCKRHEAIEFIKAVYGLGFNDRSWVCQQQRIIMNSANFLDRAEFKENFPELYKRISRQKGHLKNILLHFMQLVNEDLQKDGKPLFFASYNTLQNVCNVRSRDTMVRMITQFVTLNLMEKPEDKDIPQKALNKAKAIAASHGHNRHCNYYVIDDYGVNTLSDSEELAKLLKEKNVRALGYSREMFLRTFSAKENETKYADIIYPQLKDLEKKTSEKSDNFTLLIATCILNEIESKGYVTENEVIEILKDSEYSASKTNRQIKRSLQEILDTYGLKGIRANKEVKEQYNVVSGGYPFIIVKNTEQDESE